MRKGKIKVLEFVLSPITQVSGRSDIILRVAPIPSKTGITTSMRTTSGLIWRVTFTASFRSKILRSAA